MLTAGSQLNETSVSFAQSSGELVLDRLAHDVETVVLPDLFRHPEGDVVALDGLRSLGVVDAQPLGPHEDGARRRPADEQFVARAEISGKRRCKRMGSAGDLRAYQCILSAEARCIDLLQRITSQVIVSVSCGSI